MLIELLYKSNITLVIEPAIPSKHTKYWDSLHFCTICSPVRSCPLIMIMNSTDYRGQKDHVECLHTHTLLYLSLFFHQVSDNFDVPFRFKGHSKLSAIFSSLCSLSVYNCVCLLHMNFRACICAFTCVYTCFVLPFVLKLLSDYLSPPHFVYCMLWLLVAKQPI